VLKEKGLKKLFHRQFQPLNIVTNLQCGCNKNHSLNPFFDSFYAVFRFSQDVYKKLSKINKPSLKN
jgi:hypothetical protein